MNVMVCAGIQNHSTANPTTRNMFFQSIARYVSTTGQNEKRRPLLISVSVNRWKIIISKPNSRFISVDFHRAAAIGNPLPGSSPRSSNASTPAENSGNTNVSRTPMKPQIMARCHRRIPRSRQRPDAILPPSSSPIVPSRTNFPNPIR